MVGKAYFVWGSDISIISAPHLIYSIPLLQRLSISSGIPSTLYSLGIPIFLPLIFLVSSDE